MSAVLPDPHPGQLSDEDGARANFYALIGRFFYDVPDAGLLAEISRASGIARKPEEGGPLAQAWEELQSACKSTPQEAVKQEYDALFIGVGKAQVTLYTSRHISGMSADKHLVRLRQQLGSWGLVRRDKVFEVEDHISGLCDVMRFLIGQNQALSEQRLFYEHFVYPGVVPLCDAVDQAVSAVFYKHVAAFARAFFELEKAAFEMLE